MNSLVLEPDLSLSIRELDPQESLNERDVRIKLHTVGICGSDVHYYTHGRIGPFVVKEPMILGHEASGTVVEVGSAVLNLQKGDRVCMEPGIPDPYSRVSREGLYNLDPAVRFWATPPVHGVLRSHVVHPADFTFKLPDNVAFAEGAMVEPLAVGMHAANKAQVRSGDIALVTGAGPIGMVTVLSALAAGCAEVIVTDTMQPKLDRAQTLGQGGKVTTVNIGHEDLHAIVRKKTASWGVDKIFECSGSTKVVETIFEHLCPGGTIVWVGMPVETIAFDVVAAQVKEARIETVFRYAHVYPRVLKLMGSGKIDVKPLITDTFPFEKSIEAFDFAVQMPSDSVKAQIELPQ